jgi:SAM-dependent methyltransferase
MALGMTSEFDAGERIYLGKTTRDATVREHLARYEFALGLVGEGGIVVDVACGSGYGSQMLASRARHVVGLDISESALTYAVEHHRGSRLSFLRADLDLGLPLQSGVVDDLVSFETIEHLSSPERLISEYARALRQGGHLILSTPDRRVYSDLSRYSNPFHRTELTRRELVDFVRLHFDIETMYGQVRWSGFRFRERIKRVVKYLLPAGVLRIAVGADAFRRRLAARMSPVKPDLSMQPIVETDSELYFFLVIVARKPRTGDHPLDAASI